MAAKRFTSLPNTASEWPGVRGGLQKLAEKKVRGVEELEAFFERNDRYKVIHPPFNVLRRVLGEADHVTEEFFAETLLPWIAKKALQVEELFQEYGYKLPKLPKHVEGEVTLSRDHCCCLLALAFFNTFGEVKGGYQEFTFLHFLLVGFFKSQRSKLICLLKYFERVMTEEAAGNTEFLAMAITVRKRKLSCSEPDEFWGKCSVPLGPFEPLREGLIEGAHGCLQVDFANAYIGGGVLREGNVQEEIRFVINPECLVSMLICEEMDNLEAILIEGAEQFSTYSGYGGGFTYTGSHEDTNPVDAANRRCVSIVAIDAIPVMFSGGFEHQKPDIVRELNKAYAGFSFRISSDEDEDPAKPVKLAPVATGNWGCGAFGGDKELKTLVQWMAASKAGRSIKYFTFSDTKLSDKQQEMVECLLKCRVTVGQLYTILTASGRGKLSRGEVFNFVITEALKIVPEGTEPQATTCSSE